MARKYATVEEAREAKRERNRLASKRRKAERAIAAGRESGRVGGVRKYRTDDEVRAARRAALVRWRERNAEEVRVQDAAAQRRKRAEQALARGRVPGQIGRTRIFSDEERKENRARSMARWRERNPARAKEAQHRSYAANKDKVVARSRNRKLCKQVSGSYTPADIRRLWDLQGGCCVFCLKPMRPGKFEIDHHVPLAQGGPNDRGNLRLLHRKCNRSKGARDPAYHAQRNGLLCW